MLQQFQARWQLKALWQKPCSCAERDWWYQSAQYQRSETQQNKNVDIYKSLMRLRSKVLLGESRAALVQTMEELVEMVNVNGGKVLMVDCKEEGCVEDIPDLWKRVQLTRDAGLFQLSVDGDFILEKKEFTAMISSQLLPVAYSFAPDLVVLRSSSLREAFETNFR